MRLKKLLIAGFKSFVDLTDIRLPSYLVGVVGPNGCGKSNVIDAVRWVMGESSAKLLRGDSMSDVIFNGSTSRKPISKASVELIFDNSDGKAKGAFARFSEISIKRILTRDGTSDYLINNVKARRKDVLDIFRGTGLGPRSYSIIEQGMVSRIVEAKPEEIRSFIEDAAGISHYKERRRDTENRIEHTRTNLERVDDIRQEIARQLSRLKRQSKQAKRFKELKNEEQALDGQCRLLQLRQFENQLLAETRASENKRNQMESEIAKLRKVEAAVAKLQKQRADVREQYDRLQEEYYPLSAEIAEIEQKIEFLEQNKASNAVEARQLETERQARMEQIRNANQQRLDIERKLSTLQPALEQKEAELGKIQIDYDKADQELREWSAEMQRYNEKQYQPRQQVQIQQSRIEYLENRIRELGNEENSVEASLEETSSRLGDNELATLKQELSDHDQACRACESELQTSETALEGILNKIDARRDELSRFTNHSHELNSRLNSLEEIQSAYLADDDHAIENWIHAMGLEGGGKLFEQLSIAEGWEDAVDRVLGDLLSARCIEKIVEESLKHRPDATLSLIQSTAGTDIAGPHADHLLAKIDDGKEWLCGLLDGVRTANSIEDALARQGELKGQDIFVTRNGDLVGSNWIRFCKSDQQKTGMLVRREEISQLRRKIEKTNDQIQTVKSNLSALEEQRQLQDQTLRKHRNKLAELRSGSSQLHGQLGREETVWQESLNRLERYKERRQYLADKLVATKHELEQAQASRKTFLSSVEEMQKQREAMLEKNRNLDETASTTLSEFNRAREEFHKAQLAAHQLTSELNTLDERLARMEKDQQSAFQRLDDLALAESTRNSKSKELKGSLDGLLQRKTISGGKLAKSKDHVSDIDDKLTAAQRQLREINGQVENCREALSAQDLRKQEARVLHDRQLQTMHEHGFQIDEIAAELPQDASIGEWEQKLDKLRSKVEKIGPVNLVAIQEFEELSERETYLDSQHSDLTEALATLENAIKKIDHESRTRFKDTFDRINSGFNRFFPELFGGGKADLLLVADDLLTAGVTVMARPPGKRNSHIHLLSGGEKALTAVALLFALFELNPAPFCLLDEVDAPLDDANVGRYCDTLKRLANKSQLIVVTHNKITMESMDRLLGVTMEESGVSRIVSVDVGQAIEMAVG